MINVLILIANVIILVLNLYLPRKKLFKWEYYKDGIRIYNKKEEVIIENEKPLIK